MKEGRNPLDVRRRRTTHPEAMTPHQAHRRLAFALIERSGRVVGRNGGAAVKYEPLVTEARKAMNNEGREGKVPGTNFDDIGLHVLRATRGGVVLLHGSWPPGGWMERDLQMTLLDDESTPN